MGREQVPVQIHESMPTLLFCGLKNTPNTKTKNRGAIFSFGITYTEIKEAIVLTMLYLKAIAISKVTPNKFTNTSLQIIYAR